MVSAARSIAADIWFEVRLEPAVATTTKREKKKKEKTGKEKRVREKFCRPQILLFLWHPVERWLRHACSRVGGRKKGRGKKKGKKGKGKY